MATSQHQTVQEQFTRTAEAFAKFATRDTPDVLAERVAFAELSPGDALLDVACGAGAFTLAAAPRVRFARGVDLTAEMLRHAREAQRAHGVENAAFDRAEGEHLPYAAASFDFVTCQFAFHHMPRPDEVLREMVRVTKPGGRVFLVDSVAPKDAAPFALHNHIERLRDPSHTTTLSLAQFRDLFAEQELTTLKEEICERPRSFNQWMLRAGHPPSDASYRAARAAMEGSIAGDRAGFKVQVRGDDLAIVHDEGLFLLKKNAA
ncbi:MAG TPA: methyltransferase domain-containing protein [Terriglobia bacterium]|nr:methyltransferase domain-containing protein [Terriglobia bacterium]